MALQTNATKLANLFNPQVVGDTINAKLVDAIRFAPLARVDYTLAGRAGDTITLPSYAYIGDAATVAEGADIPIKQLVQSTKTVKIHKIGNGVQITDEAVLSGYGNPVQEAVDQLILSIASQADNEMLATLGTIGSEMTSAVGEAGIVNGIAKALTLFGEDIDGAKALLVSPATYAAIRNTKSWVPGTELGAAAIIRGSVGMVHGCEIIVSNKLNGKNAAYIVKPGALAMYLKRDTLVESDRDIINKSTVLTADKHFATYLYNESSAIKLTL